jgi:hypothetical protein
MRRTHGLFLSFFGPIAFLAYSVAAPAAHAANFRVTTTADDSGQKSLRRAILDANANPGRDVILFSIPGTKVHTIRLRTPLPPVTDQVMIDGASQGNPGQHLIVIDGGRLPPSHFGLELSGQGSWLHHLVLHGFGTTAIWLAGSGLHAVTDCRVGTDAEGLVQVPNGTGVYVTSPGNAIAGNLISGSGRAVWLQGADQNLIVNNLLGSDRDGLPFAAAGTTSFTVVVELRQSRANEIRHNTIGASRIGINLHWSDDNIIVGNSIGISSQGGRLGILSHGIFIGIESSRNTVGGTLPGEANVFAHLGAPSPGEAWGQAVLMRENWSPLPPLRLSIGNSVRGNLMFDLDPGAMLIDLEDPGPDANDWGDVDFGANLRQNAPAIVAARQDATPFGSTLRVTGELYTPLSSSINYTIDVYATTAASSPGVCEARRYLGSRPISSNPNGIATFSIVLGVTVDPGAKVTATATVESPGHPADTSEFSPCVTVS